MSPSAVVHRTELLRDRRCVRTLEQLYSSCWGVLKEQNMSDKEQGKSRPSVKQAKLVRYQ